MRQVKTFIDQDLKGKTVLFRADFNVPFNPEGAIADSSRIDGTLPSIQALLKKGAGIILMSHLGRPKGVGPEPKYSLKPVFSYLQKILPNTPIRFIENYFPLPEKLEKPGPQEMVLFENIRFHAGETKNDPILSKALSAWGDLFVIDAFGTCHRAHSSTRGIQDFLPSFAGLLVEKEVRELEKVLHSDKKPFVALLGGAKVSDKIEVIQHLLKRVDHLLIGGAMAYTFLKAQGKEIGKSLVETEKIEMAVELLKSNKIQLPKDHVVAKEFTSQKGHVVEEIPEDHMGLDIGPKTLFDYQKILAKAQLVFWNGPVGLFETREFSHGTCELAQTIGNLKCDTIVGGGDSVAAIEKYQIKGHFTHLSTGGGASLEYVEGKLLPALEKLYIS